MDRFDKFTTRARNVLTLAQAEAQRFKHSYIGEEHLVLGLIREGDGVATAVLNPLGVDLAKLRSDVESRMAHPRKDVPRETGLTPRGKRTIELAIDESRALGHGYIGTEHLLLGLMRLDDGIAVEALRSIGVDPSRVRSEIDRVLSEAGGGDPAAPFRFDKFSDGARRALTSAQEEAQRLAHGYLGTEHLLLGLTRVRDDAAARLLEDMGVDLDKLQATVESIVGPGEGAVIGEIALTPRSKRVIELAVREARAAGGGDVGTEHILLALLREGEGIAANVLRMAGVALDGLHRRLSGAPPWRSYRGRSIEPGDAEIEASGLVRVVAIGQSVAADDATVELIALEIREAGVVIYLRARPTTPRRLGDPEAAIGDDAGTEYRVVSWSWDGSESVAAGRIELRPSPPPGASVLAIRVGGVELSVPIGPA